MSRQRGGLAKAAASRKIVEVGIVPIIRVESVSQAITAAEAVYAGGVAIVEVTMTVPGAVDAIAQLVKRLGKEVLVGAGTVLDVNDARRCLDAGARFLVSPGFDLETVKLAQDEDVPIIAGALTATEVIMAWKAGADFVKVFPCSLVGGPKYIKALRGPLPQIPLVPTGGVNLETAADYIRAGATALGVGGELVSTAALKAGRAQSITDAAKQYAAIVRETRNQLAAPASAGD
jgi:2-dehydro-3-deoxyphosphogluconate aldolase/(4S)-4-hydroxy-2-oxoglutarate aldolase